MRCITTTVLIAMLAYRSGAFFPRPSPTGNAHFGLGAISQTRLSMVFDFLRKRSEEGIAQIQNIASKAAEGKLGEALQETGEYVRTRNKIDAENLVKLTNGLSRSRDRLLSAISGAIADGEVDLDARLSTLEEVLLQADIGSSTTSTILADLRSYAETNQLMEMDDILPVLRARLIEALTPREVSPGVVPPSGIIYAPTGPTVMFVIGANGMGKTTTIGKIAGRLRNEGNLTVLLGACDTFRAAAVEQLGEWALRANVSIEVPTPEERGGNPVPVVTRSVRRAISENFDVVIIDTSGRLSNNFELTQQLQDMKAAIVQEIPSAPHETLLVVDGSLGRNAVEQAAAWRKYVGVTGLAITKLDGTARGGFVVSVVRDLGLPVKFIGVGEKIDDLRDFEPRVFVDALLGNDQVKAKFLQERAEKMLGASSKEPDRPSAGEAAATVSNGELGRLKASFANSQNGGVGEREEAEKRKRKPRHKKRKN